MTTGMLIGSLALLAGISLLMTRFRAGVRRSYKERTAAQS